MEINEITAQECEEIVARARLARLVCSRDDQPYVVPVYIAYEEGFIYVFSTIGKKVDWMRVNPRVCMQIDEIRSQSDWVSVVVNGRYEELREPQHTAEHSHARSLEKQHRWWLNAMAERRIRLRDQAITPVFFRIHIESMTGLRGWSEQGQVESASRNQTVSTEPRV